MKKDYLIIILILLLGLSGCSRNKVEEEPRTDLEFTVVPREDVPNELMKVIQDKQSEEFSMTFGDKDYLYIVKGYGTVPTGGYTITADSLYEQGKEIYFHTTLTGPKPSEPVNKMQTSAYIVVKTFYIDKKVIFN